MKKNNIKKTLTYKLSKEDLKRILLYILAFFIPVIILVGIFAYLEVYPFGENTYLVVDAAGQYSGYLQYFRNIFYQGSSIFYSLSKSLGGEMYGLFSYYLSSPYNFLTLLFDRSNIPFAFVLIIILKTGSCGLTFLYYLNRRKKTRFTNLIFSTMYAMSAYVIMYGFNIMWLDSVILLPIVMAGIDDIIKHKRFLLYTVSLTLTLITNYYMGFMVCIFSCIYFAYKMLIRRIKFNQKFWKKIGMFILCSIIAALISGIILIPAFFGIQDGRASFTFDKFNLNKNFEIGDLINKFFTNSFDIDTIQNYGAPPVFCGVLANFLVLLYFLNKKISFKEKLLSLLVIAIFISSFYINGANLVWTMGNIPAWYKFRYTFAFSFMWIIIAKREFDNFNQGTRISSVIFSILVYQIIAICVSQCNYKFLNSNSIKMDVILVLIFALILTMNKVKINKNKKLNKYCLPLMMSSIFILNLINLTNNAATTMKILEDQGCFILQGGYNFFTKQYENSINNLENYDNSIYRVEKDSKVSRNDPITFEYYGVDLSTSTYSKELYNLLEKLGIEQYHVTSSYSTNTTKTVDMLLGIKYIMSFNKENIIKGYDKEYQEENIAVYKNPYTLSIGYAVNPEILDVNLDTTDTFYLQNLILKSMTGLDEDVYIKHSGPIIRTTENLDNNKKVDKDQDAKIIYEFQVENDDDLYIYFLKNIEGSAGIYINGEEKINIETKQNEMLNLGKRKIGEKIKVEIVADGDELFANKLYVYYENENTLSAQYEKLKNRQVNLIKTNDTHYECNANLNDDEKYLLLTIPYDENWKITVDGKPAEVQKVLDSLMLIKIDRNTNSVQLIYNNSKLILGLISSVIGILAFSVMIFVNKREVNKKFSNII